MKELLYKKMYNYSQSFSPWNKSYNFNEYRYIGLLKLSVDHRLQAYFPVQESYIRW